jgi:predicted enzyme related to lactoylglutathione lyase
MTLVLAAVAATAQANDGQPEVDGGPPPNPVVFWELATHDGPRSVEFFSTVFGWESTPVPGAKTYFHTLDTGGAAGSIDGGIFTLRKARPAFVAVYILVEDIEAKAEQVAAAGGLIVEAPTETLPGTWVCLFNDPSGVTFAMIEKRPTE